MAAVRFGPGNPSDIGELLVVTPPLDLQPPNRRRELEQTVRILFDEFEAALAGGRAEWKRGARMVNVIPYGIHSRGDWVDDPVGGYRSDYDVLVVVNDPRLIDPVDIGLAEDSAQVRV